MPKVFTQSEIEALASALGDTDEGLSGSEIAFILHTAKISDVDPRNTKRKRLYNAFATVQNERQNRTNILEFIRQAMKPERFARNDDRDRFEPMRANLNRALAFCGLVVDASGVLKSAEKVSTLSEAEQRAYALREDLNTRGVHPDVLKFCRKELLDDNYFHAVLEAVKSVADKIRSKTGLTDDGDDLIIRALSGDPPMLAINRYQTKSEKGEQRGFANLLRGTFGMFRNPTAHEARINWPMSKEDAVDFLSLVSLMHRRLDSSHMPPRA